MLNNETFQKESSKKKETLTSPIDINQLKSFVDTFDPYAPLTAKDKSFLNSLNIFSIEDPFQVTNQLILLLEELLEKEQQK